MSRKTIWVLMRIFIMIQVFGLAMGNVVYTSTCIRTPWIPSDAELNEVVEAIFGSDRPAMVEAHVPSNYGYDMVGTYFPNSIKTENTMILVHGIGDMRWGMLRRVKWFLDLGFNVLIYDSRASGETGGKDITLGYYEKEDLQKWVNVVKEKHPKGIIGVFGNSMGGSAALLHAGTNEPQKDVAFYIVDSAYSDLREEIEYQVSRNYSVITGFMVFYSNLITKLRSGFFYSQVRPIDSIEKTTVPVLLIHGDADRTVPVQMSRELYDAKRQGLKELRIIAGADHLESYQHAPEIYMNTLEVFITEIMGNDKIN